MKKLVKEETTKQRLKTERTKNKELQKKQKGKNKAFIIHYTQLIISIAEIEY
jgi:hypothetical protein